MDAHSLRRYAARVDRDASGAWLAAARRHPVITGLLVACTLAGAALGPLLLTEEWSLARRVLAGAMAGAGTALLVVATKLYD